MLGNTPYPHPSSSCHYTFMDTSTSDALAGRAERGTYRRPDCAPFTATCPRRAIPCFQPNQHATATVRQQSAHLTASHVRSCAAVSDVEPNPPWRTARVVAPETTCWPVAQARTRSQPATAKTRCRPAGLSSALVAGERAIRDNSGCSGACGVWCRRFTVGRSRLTAGCPVTAVGRCHRSRRRC